jgi:hypothetical protein
MSRNDKRGMCRQMLTSSLRRRQSAVAQLLRDATVISDPQKIAALNAAVARRKIEK